MSRNTLVINCDLRETRVCLIEDGVIAELHLERIHHRGTVGNIVLGRVTRVLPGMQAAFIDIGMERAAFLHVEDLIRPDDFESYLDKGDRREDEPSGKGDGSRRFPAPADEEAAEAESIGADDDERSASDAEWAVGDAATSDSEPAIRKRASQATPDVRPSKGPGALRAGSPHARAMAQADASRPAVSDHVVDSASEADEFDDLGSDAPSAGNHEDEADEILENDSLEADEEPVARTADAGADLESDDDEPDDVDGEESDDDEPDDDEEDSDDEDSDEEDSDDEDSDDEDSDDEDSDDADSDEEDSEDDESDDEDSDDEDSDEEDSDDEDSDDEDSDDEDSDDEEKVAEVADASALRAESDAKAPSRGASVAESEGLLVPPVSTTADSGSASVAEATDVVQSEALPPQAAAPLPPREARGRRRRRRRKRGNNDASAPSVSDARQEPKKAAPAARDAGRQRPSTQKQDPKAVNARDQRKGGVLRGRGRDQGRDRRGNKLGLARVSRSVPITDIVKEGNEVVVQISKEPIGTKGARVTSHISLPGRHVVYLPTVDHVGISKRIGSAKERNRLRQVIEALKPDTGGLIVRTVAEGLTKKALKTDIGYLIALWKEVSRKKSAAKAPSVLYTELDLVLKTARDLFNDDVQKIIIDDREQHARLVRFVEMFLPSRVKDIELYTGDEPIFDAYGIEDEIGRALGRKVPLPSGGYLVIDQAEALTAIDVNTGRFVGKGSKDLEETALKTNLEAVTEIAYQLRLRNIGGLVILDLIDMDHASNRDKVWRSLEQHLAKDKAKTTINRISDLGLIEMTRKRTRESLTRMLHEPCFYCDGTGQIQSRVTVAYEILRQVRRERHLLKGYSIVVNAHPAVIDLLQTEEKAAVQEAERRYMRRLDLVPRREYHLEQFDLQGR
jgi:ribonuclease G